MECLIKTALLDNGRMILFRADVLIRDGKIAAIGAMRSAGTEATTIDAAGKYVLPGAVDAHVHLQTPVGRRQSPPTTTNRERGPRPAAA